MEIHFRPIGVIHSPFQDLSGMPIQPTGEASAPGTVEIFPEFADGLKDLDGFSDIILVFYFHQVGSVKLTVVPFLDSKPRGIFATRAPTRPNPIGISVVRLLGIEGSTLRVENLDILDGTPLLDIKPYVPEFDYSPQARIGWLEKAQGKARAMKSDDRFRG
jgi:tRNA-Thr(GGU) m(6)t(6)A37 methyltransferase TsaA